MGTETFFLITLMSMGAGFFGAMLGLGGGVIIIPALTLLFHVDVKIAIAASLVSVIATSSSAATVYVQERFTNIRLGMLLEVATTLGAIGGAIIARYISGQYLYLLFAALLVYAGISMITGKKIEPEADEAARNGSPLNGEFYDPASKKTVAYVVKGVPVGMIGAGGAGIMSGLLGVGGGIIKVPIMHRVMGIPMKVAIATSNFMIGVTAAASALVYWATGKVDPAVTAPAVIGVLIGARIGTKVVGKIEARWLRFAFVAFIAFTAVNMAMKGLNL
jgi:uncharacterized protein